MDFRYLNVNNKAHHIIFAALSFEQRCENAILKSLESSNPPDEIVLFDYGESATAGAQAKRLRDNHWAAISSAASKAGSHCKKVGVDAYSMTDVEEKVSHFTLSAGVVEIDISCMTRPHVLALATVVGRLSDWVEWHVAYTIPESFGNLNSTESRAGWKDTLWLSLGNRPILRNQGLAIGLVILGHEADRIGIAFKEIEPASGICLIPIRKDRPDLHRHTYSQNREFLAFLKQLRMPGPMGCRASEFFINGGWEIEEVNMDLIVEDTCAIAQRIADAAKKMDAPIVLVPFGPKISVFASAFVLSKLCPNRTWVIYPVVKTHPIDYSDGVLKTELFSRAIFSKQEYA